MSTKAIVKRHCWAQLLAERDNPAVSILVGPRQVGKTTLLKELRTYFEVESQRVLYLNLENPLDLQKLPPNETDLITWLMDYHVILIDELYYIKNISRIFKIIVDAGQETGIKIYASGSSAIDIHKHLEESLAGRRLVTRIFPLVFSEFCLAFPTAENPKTDLFETFLTYGGLPGLLHTEPNHRSRLLREMLETYIQKDIKAFVKEENIRAYNHLLVLLAQQQGQLISVHGLSKELGIHVAIVERYLTLLEQTFVIYRIHSYAQNLANELKKSQKIYFYDSGIRNMILQNFSPALDREDTGAILESFVLTEMRPTCRPEAEIRFWRTRNQTEIDFVVIENQIPYPIEVKKTHTTSLARTKSTFEFFFKQYPKSPYGTIVSIKPKGTPTKMTDKLHLRDFADAQYLPNSGGVLASKPYREKWPAFIEKWQNSPSLQAMVGDSQKDIDALEEYLLSPQSIDFDPTSFLRFCNDALDPLLTIINWILNKELNDQFRSQMQEKWFLKNDTPKHSYNQYFGNLCPSIVAYHLEQREGYQITGLDARDQKKGQPDISASKDQQSFVFEVKYIGTELGYSKALAAGEVPSQEWLNSDIAKPYLQERYQDARKQLNRITTEASKIVVFVVCSIQPALNATLLDGSMFGYDIRGPENQDGPPIWVFRLHNDLCTLQRIFEK